jgi:hypothetical protein
MTLFSNNPAPATVLETMAARLNDEAFPVRIRNQDDHAALAATVLWSFAKMTGQDNENETFQTVLTDFLGDALHLCEQCEAEGAGEALFDASLQVALMHYRQEAREDDQTNP